MRKSITNTWTGRWKKGEVICRSMLQQPNMRNLNQPGTNSRAPAKRNICNHKEEFSQIFIPTQMRNFPGSLPLQLQVGIPIEIWRWGYTCLGGSLMQCKQMLHILSSFLMLSASLTLATVRINVAETESVFCLPPQ